MKPRQEWLQFSPSNPPHPIKRERQGAMWGGGKPTSTLTLIMSQLAPTHYSAFLPRGKHDGRVRDS